MAENGMARTELKCFRLQQGLTQFEIAEKLGYSRNHYVRVESGAQDVTLKFLIVFGKVFGKSLEEAKELLKRDKDR